MALLKKAIRLASAFQRAWKLTENPFVSWYPPGHYYSPIPDMGYIEKRRSSLFDTSFKELPAIDLNTSGQLHLLEAFRATYDNCPFLGTKAYKRFDPNNDFFGRSSALTLYCMMRHFQPKRIIEIGSGHSSAAMLDIRDQFFTERLDLMFVEPDPVRLYSVMNEADRRTCTVLQRMAQDCDAAIFRELSAGDILLIDSSHVGKIGSDVLFLLCDVLPMLKPGVVVHFHDIYWPFEYPEDWFKYGRAWNEAYFLRLFLMFNSSFQIICFCSYLGLNHADFISKTLPEFLPAESSLWLQRT